MKRHFRSPTAIIFYGLIGGVLTGLFFGEHCRVLEPFAAAFVNLLQMTVLPFLVLTLIVNIGKQSTSKAWALARYGLASLAVMTVMTLATLLFMPLMLPYWESGSFFSSKTIEPPPELNLLSEYIPANVFNSLANNVVPGVVVFCLAIGVSMISMPGKEKLLRPLDSWCDLLLRVSRVIVRMTPVGIFLLAASTCGTITLEEFGRLQGYIIMQMTAAAMLTFIIFPGLVVSVTPLTYRQVLGASWGPLITGFATGKVLVTIPSIIDAVHKLMMDMDQNATPEDREANAETAESLVPLAYVFPHAGRLLALLFIPFAAWFIGEPIDLADDLQVLAVGYMTLFGSPVVAIPYLLALLQIPDDLFQLFLLSGVYCGRLGDSTGVMYMLSFAIVTTALIHGYFKLNVRRLIATGIVTVLAFVVCLPTANQYLASSLPSYESREEIIAARHSLTHPSPDRVYREVPSDLLLRDVTRSRREQIIETGVVRVGYRPDNLPWSFFNKDDVLVGFDIDMAHVLAEDLGVDVEFIPFDISTVEQQMARGEIDVAMSGYAITPTRLLRMRFSDPVMDVTLGLVVPDHQKSRFLKSGDLQRLGDGLTLGVPDDNYFVAYMQRSLPDAKIVPLSTHREFFERNDLDAVVSSAEAGSAWTLIYPSYTVVVPQPNILKQPIGYALPAEDSGWQQTVNGWLRVTRDKRVHEELYDHWILGVDPEGDRRRWSVWNDVLGFEP